MNPERPPEPEKPVQEEPARRRSKAWPLTAVVVGALAFGTAVALLSLQAAEYRSAAPSVAEGTGGEALPATTTGVLAMKDPPPRTARAEPSTTGEAETRAERGDQRGSVKGSPAAGSARTKSAEELETEMRGILARHSGEYGVVVWQPATNTKVDINAEESFSSASIAKLPVLLALYRDAARGRLSLEDRLMMSAGDVQSGTGALQNRPPGTYLTLRECAQYLIQESDNTAWSMLEGKLGDERIRSEIASVGARSTNYGYAEHSTTPEDTLKMLQRISDPGYTSPRYSREMLDSMVNTSFEDWLPQGVPKEARIAHKIGILGSNFGDAGIVFPPEEAESNEPYYVMVLSKQTTEPAASDVMREVSLAAYRGLADPKAEPRSESPGTGLPVREEQARRY